MYEKMNACAILKIARFEDAFLYLPAPSDIPYPPDHFLAGIFLAFLIANRLNKS